MRAGKAILSQVTDWIHPEQFRRCVQRYGCQRAVKTSQGWADENRPL